MLARTALRRLRCATAAQHARRQLTAAAASPLTAAAVQPETHALAAAYTRLSETHGLLADPAQRAAIARLSQLLADIDAYRWALEQHERATAAYVAKKLAVRKEVEQRAREEKLTGEQVEARVAAEVAAAAGPPPVAPPVPRGVFLHGGVGTGKTMLMDLTALEAQRLFGTEVVKRVHLNTASLEIHVIMHQLALQQQQHALPDSGGDKTEPLASGSSTWQRYAHAARAALLATRRRRTQLQQQQIAQPRSVGVSSPFTSGAAVGNAAIWHEVATRLMGETMVKRRYGLLCFDEFAVTDAFTAAALKGVFEACFAHGVAVVATANRTPDHMKEEPRHSAASLFESFAARLQDRCDTWRLDGGADYRLHALRSQPLHLLHTPLSTATAAQLDGMYAALCAAEVAAAGPGAVTVPVAFGRTLPVPAACGGVCRVSFSALCDTPRGAADYHALAQGFHTVFLEGVPRLPAGAADIARRFITLIDELYNARVALILSAEAQPEELFTGRLNSSSGDDAPLVDLESLQSETAAEDARSRRDVTRSAGVGAINIGERSSATAADVARAVAAITGADERFAFARAVSRLAEMRTSLWVQRSKAPAAVQEALLQAAAFR